MEDVINTLQDRIIYLTGQITLIDKENIEEITKTVVVANWETQIEQHKKAISVLEKEPTTSERKLDLHVVSVSGCSKGHRLTTVGNIHCERCGVDVTKH